MRKLVFAMAGIATLAVAAPAYADPNCNSCGAADGGCGSCIAVDGSNCSGCVMADGSGCSNCVIGDQWWGWQLR